MTRFLHWGYARKLVILLLGGAALLLVAGSLLVAEDPAQPSDAIVVIGGDHKPERVKRAVELYAQGYAPRVIMSAGTVVLEGDEPLPEAEVMRRQALVLGLPASAIVMETDSRSTFENALYSRTLSRQYNLHSILLVTSRFHSARAKRIFQDVFGAETTIRLQPATADTCSVCWLFDPSQVYVVVYEYWNWLQYWASQAPSLTKEPHPRTTNPKASARQLPQDLLQHRYLAYNLATAVEFIRPTGWRAGLFALACRRNAT